MKNTIQVTLKTIAVIAALMFCLWSVFRIKAYINFTQNCGGYIERAANANTIELATRELSRAIEYMDLHELKSGYTSVIYRTPDEDIGYWHANMTAALSELRAIKADATPLERSNVLIKLRESLISNGEKSEDLNVPSGISIYPNNTAFFWWGWISAFVCFIAGIAAFLTSDYF